MLHDDKVVVVVLVGNQVHVRFDNASLAGLHHALAVLDGQLTCMCIV